LQLCDGTTSTDAGSVLSVFGKVFSTSWEIAWNLWFEKTSFQTFRGFATPAAAQTDGFRLGRKEAVVVSDPETSSSRITDMEIRI